MKITGKIEKLESGNPMKIVIAGKTFSVWDEKLKKICSAGKLITAEYTERKKEGYNVPFKNIVKIEPGGSLKFKTEETPDGTRTKVISEQLHRTQDEINREVALREAVNLYTRLDLKMEDIEKHIITTARLFNNFLKEG